MGRWYFTRADVQSALERNEWGAPVAFVDRENQELDFTGDNSIVYMLLSAQGQPFADDTIHVLRYNLQVIHYHKRKLDTIAPLMREVFNTSPAQFGGSSMTNDWIPTYYRLYILSDWEW